MNRAYQPSQHTPSASVHTCATFCSHQAFTAPKAPGPDMPAPCSTYPRVPSAQESHPSQPELTSVHPTTLPLDFPPLQSAVQAAARNRGGHLNGPIPLEKRLTEPIYILPAICVTGDHPWFRTTFYLTWKPSASEDPQSQPGPVLAKISSRSRRFQPHSLLHHLNLRKQLQDPLEARQAMARALTFFGRLTY